MLIKVFETESIQWKIRKLNQFKPKQKKNCIWFGYIQIIFYSTAWFGLVCGFYFTN